MFQSLAANLDLPVGFLQSQRAGGENPVIIQQLFVSVRQLGADQFPFAFSDGSLGHRSNRGIQRLLFIGRQCGQLRLRRIIAVDIQGRLALDKLRIKPVVTVCLVGACLERVKLRLDLGNDVAHTGQVLFRVIHLADRILAPLLETGDADDFFKQQSTLFRLAI